ncbi:LLM class flavin-dependent oxidoreductase [Dasania marina]|uniref:LLM class flavin-dependent oxidoreductase n=1 Tax=Dasania marina TaxID=471499 RepID=UPI0030D7E7F6|tara:strand:+ start:25888 stop:26907 length:1020 start_codon:yes stop_codon:yes gene_type:complete
MDFSLFLSTYMPDSARGGKSVFNDMLEQAQLAEDLGFASITLPHHHLINILMNPAPLATAVKIASVTKHIPIITSVLALPLLDMRQLAGEIAVTDILTDGRIEIGVGRGAFPYEFDRLGVDFSKSREIFDESLNVLIALLTSDEEVSWDGDYYQFSSTKVQPRPIQDPMPPIWMAALFPESVYHCAKRGFNIQTSPLKAEASFLKELADAFHRGAKDAGKAGENSKLSMLRGCFVCDDNADVIQKQRLAYEYYERFSNAFETDGEVINGEVSRKPMLQTEDEMAANLLIGTSSEVIDKLGIYAEAGIDDINLNMDMGASHLEIMRSMEALARDIMPQFK